MVNKRTLAVRHMATTTTMTVRQITQGYTETNLAYC